MKKTTFLFVLSIIISCQTPAVYQIGDSDYCLIGDEGKTYVGYRKVLHPETMYLNVYYPRGDTLINEVFWTDYSLYICLVVGNKNVGTMVIDNIDTFNFPLYISDTQFLSELTVTQHKKLKPDGVGWFGQL